MATATVTAEKPQKAIPWWLVLVEGIAAVILGLMLLVWPVKTWVVIVPFIGLYWLFDGIFAIVSIFIDHRGWGWKLFIGIIGIVAGWFLFMSPIAGAVAMAGAIVWIIGFMGLFSGIAKLIQAFQGAGWGAGLLGALMIILGIVILDSAFTNPLITAAIVPWVVGFSLLIFGISALVLAFRIKKIV
jgi:uncharacterized membrane protein HdeD (DUF308 family)